MNRMNYLMNGLAALAFIVLFSQCAGKTDNQTTSTPAQANAELSGMKIAYVEIDTLLAKYYPVRLILLYNFLFRALASGVIRN